jgi:hypothetical protein
MVFDRRHDCQEISFHGLGYGERNQSFATSWASAKLSFFVL